MKYQQNLLLGAVFILLAEFCMATMGALVKVLGQALPYEMVVFSRNLMGLLFLLPILLQQGVKHLGTDCLRFHLLRSLAGLSAMYCFFYALIHLPLADGMLLKMTAPLFMPLIALLWMGEGISRWSLYALLLGFVGVWIVVEPGSETNWIALVGLAGGLFAAIAKVSIRRLARTEPTTRIVFYFALIGTLVSAVPAFWSWMQPGWYDVALLLAVGLIGTVGQLALTRGYSIANAGTVAPFTYFSVIFGGLFGYLFWDEIPDMAFISGAVLIAVSGLLTLKKKPAVLAQADAMTG
ncbi:MAG: DMT family transporter [Chromatiales bacterium]|jgi:drug/metabolite transporter (DMT)-like permease